MNNDPQNGQPPREKKAEEVCPGKKDKLDLVSATAEIQKKNGPEFWRSLEELAGKPEFKEMMHREFPKGASEWLDAVSRRGFLKLMGSSLALAGMTACTKQPFESIVPYVRQPENLTPGVPKFYATAFTMGGYAQPLLVTSREFRPIKVEGNDRHQATLGATDVFAQASLLDLYDPDRSQNVLHLGGISDWGTFTGQMLAPLAAQKKKGGAGVRFLSRPFSSPTQADQIAQVQKVFPQAKWHFYSPVNRDNVYEGARMAFGQPVETIYKLDAPDVIVSLDADFFQSGHPGQARYARDFAKRRDPDSEKMSRLYVIESTPSATGAKADHRLPLQAFMFDGYVRFLASDLGVYGQGAGSWMGATGDLAARAMIPDLMAHQATSVVIVGDHQSPAVHALAHAMNAKLGNVGKTVFYTDPVLNFTGNQNESLKELIADMKSGQVEMLVILGGNPVYDAPADFGFEDALKSSNVPLRIHLGQHNDETAELCHWHVPEAHYLEAWGDTRAYDGTVSIVQPLIAPLYGGKSAIELLSLFTTQGESTGYSIVQNYWKSKTAIMNSPAVVTFEMLWRRWLEQGWIDGTTSQPKMVAVKTTSFPAPAQTAAQGTTEIIFRPDPSIHDGQFANNGWLQELPKPMTKVTWDNPLMMSPAMGDRLKVENKDMVRVQLQDGKSLDLPVWIQAGHPDNSVTVFLGYGRTRVGRVGNEQGFNTYALRTSAAPWFTTGARITKTGAKYVLASTQGYQAMDVDGDIRQLVQTRNLEEYKKDQEFNEDKPENTMYPGFDYSKEPYSWGMAIDLNACVGCNTCIIACQSENNIPVVGKDQVNRGRHMHWLRVDAYYQGDRDNPKAYFQPLPCMQCENAPCELVCPVGATTHSTEGLNDMIYNRCVGTRYCSNNCPYKVRRFNFFLFQDWDTPQFKMARNPEVTVRSRGVMEKCTYCIQRISQHRIDSERTDDGNEKKNIIESLQTACQQACPANAIVFGNINDPDSLVSKWKAKNRNYGLLQDLNTRPRTTYLAEIRNPNPELEKSS